MRQYSGVIGYTHLGSVAQLVVQPTNASTRAASLRSFGAAQRACSGSASLRSFGAAQRACGGPPSSEPGRSTGAWRLTER